MPVLRRAVAAAACLAVLSIQAAAAGPLGDFNALVFGDFTAPSSDVEGRLYAGGNVSLSNYSVGDKLTGSLVGGDSLVVGGDLQFTSGAVYHGNVAVGGSAAGVDSSVRWGLINAGYALNENLGAGGLPVDFAAEQARLSGISAALAGLADTGTSLSQWSQVYLTGDGSAGRQVFTVDAADLAAATNLVVQGVAEGAEVVVNVTGSAAAMSGGLDQFFERNNESVIFNFFEAETLDLGSIGVQGSILAVDADITTAWGVVVGQVVAASWNGPMQVNKAPYDGTVPVGEETPGEEIAVPEPGLPALMGTALIALYGMRRRAARAEPR